MNNAQPNKFQYILNIRGVDEEILDNAPDGWLNTKVSVTRSKSYMGLFRGLQEPVKFVTKAAYLLRKEFYNSGINAFVKQKINQLNPSNWAYSNIYSGRLDFSQATDEIASFTVNSTSDDFTVQLNANDSTDYAIQLDVPEAINLELTPLSLKEQASFVPSGPPDGIIHSDYFVPMALASNQQNGVNYSSQDVQYSQIRSPDFSTNPHNFFCSRVDGKLFITGSISGRVYSVFGSNHLKLYIINNSGVIRLSLIDTAAASHDFNIVINQVLDVVKGEKLFLYMQQVDSETSDTGITITGGEIVLAYDTISPATMCKVLPAFAVFQQLLQAMNTNTNSGPNQPVPCKSNLLNGPLSNLMITSSDSIRDATGSLFYVGDTLFPGSYKVLSDSVIYGGRTFITDDVFPYLPGVLHFTGTGVLEKIVSGFVGTVYNPGDTLQIGGTYLIGGDPGTIITYNAISLVVGGNTPQFFKYILGQDTFTVDNDTGFVEQTGASPQLIISFKDFFQSIYSVQGGNCSFGIENGICFIENLDYVYRGTIGSLNAGVVDTAIKIQTALDIMFNKIKVGYQDKQYSVLNGFSEVNSTQNYITSLVTPQKELNLISAIRADPYGIEEIRVSQNDTAASRSDNDAFFIYKKADPEATVPFTYYHPLRTETLLNITGVDPSYYNWILSPKQNLLRGGNFLASIFYNMKGYKITLASAPKNTGMVTTDLSGRRVAEADPVYISNLPAPLFLPYYATFKPGLVNNALSIIDSVPYGFVTFTYNGTPYKMFIDNISVDIGENTEQEFKGLLTPGNDLTTLIH